VWRRSIRPCELARFLAIPTTTDVLAGPRARAMFLRLLSGPNQQGRVLTEVTVLRQEGATCPVCLDEMSNVQGVRLVTCGTCGNSVHRECFNRWKRSRGRRGVSCVVCRARWRETREGDVYVNLSVYVNRDDNAVQDRDEEFCAG
jgi:Ring finger domain